MKRSHKFSYFISFLLLALVPALSFADFTLAGNNFKTLVDYVLSVLNILVPILSALAFIVFFWGLSKFILNSNKPDDIKNGKNYMIWGVLVLFILLSFRAIIGFISNNLEFGGNATVIPTLNTNGQ